jgi:hypothetical protein
MKIFTATFFWVPKLFSCVGMRACTDTYKTHPQCLHSSVYATVSLPKEKPRQAARVRSGEVCALRPPGVSWWVRARLLVAFLSHDMTKCALLGCSLTDGNNNNTTWVRSALSRGAASFWLPASNGALPAFQLRDESREKTVGRDIGALSACNYLDGIDDKSVFGTLPIQVKLNIPAGLEIAGGQHLVPLSSRTSNSSERHSSVVTCTRTLIILPSNLCLFLLLTCFGKWKAPLEFILIERLMSILHMLRDTYAWCKVTSKYVANGTVIPENCLRCIRRKTHMSMSL